MKKKVFFTTLLIVIIILSVETLLHAVHFLRYTSQKKLIDPKLSISFFKESPWATEYFKEFHQTYETRYEPFYEWRRYPFSGKHINISKDGIRKTWNPGFREGFKPKEIFFMGGSTIWGDGARDEHTIPSYFSKKINEYSQVYNVTNYGEVGYTLTQEMIYLIHLIKEGKIPDYVIFYDGVNDVFASYQNGVSGKVQNLEQRREKLATISDWGMVRKGIKNILRDESFIYTYIHKIIKKIRNDKSINRLAGSGMNDQQLTALAVETAHDYWKDVKVIKELADLYHFKYFFIWQPVLYTNKSATAEEKSYYTWGDPNRIKFYEIVYKLMKEKSHPHFYNIDTALDKKTKSVYMDFCHLSEQGNEIITDNILEIFTNEVNK